MLQWLRDNLKSFAWTLWLVIAAFVVFYIPDFLRPAEVAGDVAATVGSDQVSLAEFRRAYQRVESNYQRTLQDRFTPELARGIQIRLLNQLVAEKILVREARGMGLGVSDEELQRAILDQGFADEAGRFVGSERYTQALRASGFPSPAVFEGEIREQLLLDKLQAVLASNIYVPESEVEASYRDEVERVSLRYLELPGSRAAAEVTVTPEEVASHFDARREEYRRPEQRVVSYLLVDVNRLRASIEVPEADLRAYYDQHPEEFTQQEQVRARHILLNVNDQRSEAEARSQLEAARRRIEAGADFGAVAREISEDTRTKDRGGDLGFFGRGENAPEFEAAAFEAAQTLELPPGGAGRGKLVGPVATPFSMHLIEVLGYRPGGQRPFEEASAQVRFRLQGERAQAEAERRAAALAERIEQEKLATKEQLQSLATGAADLVFETSAPFGKAEAVRGIGQAPELTEAAFGLALGGISAPVRVPRGWAILHLDEVKEPRIPDLAEVEPQVRRALTQQKQQEQAMALMTAARGEIAAGRTLEQVASGLGLEVKDSGEVGRTQAITGLGVNPALAEAALALDEGQVGGPVAHRQGAVLFQVVARKRWDPAAFARDKEATRQRLEAQEVERVLGALVERRKQELEARPNRELAKKLGLEGPGPDTT